MKKCVLRSSNNSLLVFFSLLSFAVVLTLCSSDNNDNNKNDDELVYDVDGKPLKTNTLYYAFRIDQYLDHSISYSPNEKGNPPFPVVESGEPIVSQGGAPMMFHSVDPSKRKPPTIEITTGTPLTISFLGGWYRWFVQTSFFTNSRFLMIEAANHSPSFFIKKSNRRNEYYIAFKDRDYVKIEQDSSSGLRRLAATGHQADSDLLQLQFRNIDCIYVNSHHLFTPHKMMEKEASTSKAYPSI